MKEIRLLHIIDDIKFIESCKITFEVRGLKNYFLKSGMVTEEYLNREKINILVIHFLRNPEVNFLNSAHLSIPVFWFFWGADGFRLGKFHNKFLSHKTRKVRLKLAFKLNFRHGCKILLKQILNPILEVEATNRNLIQSFDKIDVIIPVVPGDYDLLKAHYPLKSRLFHLNYIIPVFDKSYDTMNEENILIGNSSSYSSNHMEVIDRLSRMNLENRKVIIPLSYGDKAYGRYIIKYAKKRLAGRVHLLTEFLSFEAYQKVVQSCGIVVMNHYRQQALGNIIQFLMLGSHIYLNPSSTVFQYLKENGFIFSSTESLDRLKSLSPEEQAFNRAQCRKVFGPERQHERLNQLLEASKALLTT